MCLSRFCTADVASLLCAQDNTGSNGAVCNLELPAQDAAEFVAGLQSVLDQFAHAMLHIGQGYTLQEKAKILAITQGPLTKARDIWRKGKASQGQAAETVIARAPEWDTDHAMPASWTLPGVSNVFSLSRYPPLSVMNGRGRYDQEVSQEAQGN